MNQIAYATLISATVVACAATPSTEPVEDQSRLETTDPAACTPATQADVLANMAKQPIVPPRHAAGLDLAGDDAWDGLTRAAVESQLCAGTEIADDGTDPDAMTEVIYGGTKDAPIVEIDYDKTTTHLKFIALYPGYTGGLDFKSRDGAHAYSIHVGSPVTRDGQPIAGTWNDHATLTELADGMVATFAPELPSLGADCVASTHCLGVESTSGDGSDLGFAFGARDVGFYIHVPAGSTSPTPDYIYLFPHPAGMTPPPH